MWVTCCEAPEPDAAEYSFQPDSGNINALRRFATGYRHENEVCQHQLTETGFQKSILLDDTIQVDQRCQ